MITYTIEKLSGNIGDLSKNKSKFKPTILKFKHSLQGNTSKIYSEKFEYVIGEDWYKDPLEYKTNYTNRTRSNWPSCHWMIKDDEELASLLSFDLKRVTRDCVKIINSFNSNYNKIKLTLDKTCHVVSAFALSPTDDENTKIDVLYGFRSRQLYSPIPDVLRRQDGYIYVTNYIHAVLDKLDNTKSEKEKVNIINSLIHDVNRYREIFCDYDFSCSNFGTINDIT